MRRCVVKEDGKLKDRFLTAIEIQIRLIAAGIHPDPGPAIYTSVMETIIKKSDERRKNGVRSSLLVRYGHFVQGGVHGWDGIRKLMGPSPWYVDRR